jgi:hypothetical protein
LPATDGNSTNAGGTGATSSSLTSSGGRFSLLGPLFESFADTGDWARPVRLLIGDEVPPGIVVLRVDEDRKPHAEVGEARAAIPGHTVPTDVVIDSAVDDGLSLTVAGSEVSVAPLEAAIETIDLDGADLALHVALGDDTLRVEGLHTGISMTVHRYARMLDL